MKTKILLFAALFVLVSLPSCDKGPDPINYDPGFYGAEGDKGDKGTGPASPFFFTGLVTVKLNENDALYLKYGELNLLPDTQLKLVPNRRAVADIYVSAEKDASGKYRMCSVNWIEPVEEGTVRIGLDYGADPGDSGGSADKDYDVVWGDGLDVITDSGFTRLEDGFLTIHYNTWWGSHPVHHDFYLREHNGSGTIRLVQNGHGDAHDVLSDGLICFDLNKYIKRLKDETTITFHWKKLDGSHGSINFEIKAGK